MKTIRIVGEKPSKVALCYGGIDSKVKSLGNGKCRQYFTPRNPKSAWSALNKKYIKELTTNNLIYKSGIEVIKTGKENGGLTALDHVKKSIIPGDLQAEFDKNPMAYENYQNFAPSYRKSYLYWLNQAKRTETRKKHITEIIQCCAHIIKSEE